MADPFRVLVTGSRDWEDYDTVRAALAVAVYQQLPAIIVHGACPAGADAIASWWVRQMGRNLDLTEERHPADWRQHGKAAGYRRNAEMVALGARLCLAFTMPCTKPTCRKPKPHDSHGTAHCADLAKRAGITVRRFPPAPVSLDHLQEKP